MLKLALGISYHGKTFRGWQYQEGQRTVQSCVEEALTKVAAETITTVCAGRTDRGVHALGQVIHFTTSAKRQITAWIQGTNSFLPQDIRVQWAQEVPMDFNARFSAVARRYHYLIYNHKVRPIILRDLVSWEWEPLNISWMNQGAIHLLGEHDFSSFRAKACQAKTAFRNVQRLTIQQRGPLIMIDIQANAFLHHMVRNITGVLLAIGQGKKSPSYTLEVLHARNRQVGYTTADPHGLYLVEVVYPERWQLPKTSCWDHLPSMYFSSTGT